MREVTFTEEMVNSWCERNNDNNPIHTDEDIGDDSTFGQRIVPGMMLLDRVSGLLDECGSEGDEVILTGITAARFRDPVLLGETVKFDIVEITETNKFTNVDFEARVEERGSLVMNGVASVVIK